MPGKNMATRATTKAATKAQTKVIPKMAAQAASKVNQPSGRAEKDARTKSTAGRSSKRPNRRSEKQTDAQLTIGASDQQEAILKLGKLIKGIRIAMLTTIDEDGKMISRPMGTQKVEFDGRLWFFSKLDSGKVKCIEANQHVNVAYADPKASKYISVSGTARTVEDREKIKELWTPFLKAWFPDGVDDPEIALICIDVESAEFWDSPGRWVNLIGMATAVATGKEFKGIGDFEKIELQ